MKNVSWDILKQFATTKKIALQYLDMTSHYEVICFDSYFVLSCVIDKQSSNSELQDFEGNFKASANKPIEPLDQSGRKLLTISPFSDSNGFRFRGTSFSGTISANSTQSIDYKIEQERFINGGRLILDAANTDDQVSFRVVDVDNVLGFGAGVVLDEFIKDYYLPVGESMEVSLDYPARIPSGLYLRMIYKNTGDAPVKVKCNLYLHWKAE